jgi:hypothetical protein
MLYSTFKNSHCDLDFWHSRRLRESLSISEFFRFEKLYPGEHPLRCTHFHVLCPRSRRDAVGR